MQHLSFKKSQEEHTPYFVEENRICEAANANNMMNCIGMINWCIQKTAEKIVNEVCQAHCHCPHLQFQKENTNFLAKGS